MVNYKFKFTSWVGLNRQSNSTIPGKFAQVVDRKVDGEEVHYKLMNEHLLPTASSNPLWVKESALVSFDYKREHAVRTVKFNFEYISKRRKKIDFFVGEHTVEVPDLTSELAPVALVEQYCVDELAIAVKWIEYRLWGGELWASSGMPHDLNPAVTELSIRESQMMMVDAKSKLSAITWIEKWASSRIIVDGQFFIKIPGEPRIRVVSGFESDPPFIKVDRVFEYTEGIDAKYFRVDDEVGLNRYLREQIEIFHASTGVELLVNRDNYIYTIELCGCLQLKPEIDAAEIQYAKEEQMYRESYQAMCQRLEEVFPSNPQHLKRALLQYLAEKRFQENH